MAVDSPGKSIVLGNVRKLRNTLAMEISLRSLLPPSVPKSPIETSPFENFVIGVFFNFLFFVIWAVLS